MNARVLKGSRKKWLVLGIVILQVGLLCGWFHTLLPKILIYNYSASEPRGWYLILPDKDYKVGDLVAFELPESAQVAYDRSWMKKGDLMLKKIGAFEGTAYTITDTEFQIAGHYIGPVFATDRQGLPMPKVRGRFLVAAGNFLPVSEQYANSFDGRYFADIPIEKIHYKVMPILTE